MIDTRLNQANLTRSRPQGGSAGGPDAGHILDRYSPGADNQRDPVKLDLRLLKAMLRPIPTANAEGNYQVRTYFEPWIVIDQNGLNVRIPKGFPEHPDSRQEDWPKLPDMSQEDTKLGAFPPLTPLTAVMGKEGIQYLFDVNGSPWMMVEGKGADGSTLRGFVRSHQEHIRPRQD